MTTALKDTELRALMRDIENDTIDKSQWIPRRECPVNAIREARGDVSEHQGRYVAQNSLLPVDRLLNENLINQDEHSAAMEIISLREVAMSSLGYARHRFVSEWLGRSSTSDECPFTVYIRIMRLLSPWQSHLIERLCFMPPSFMSVRENDWRWIRHCSVSIHESFEKLKKSIDDVREAQLKSATEEGFCTP